MKQLVPLLCCALLGANGYAQKSCPAPIATPPSSGIAALDSLDSMIQAPYPKSILTDRAFDKSIYQDQQAIGGSTIKEGKVVGVNATVDEKSLTINGGTNIQYWKNTGFVLQGTLSGKAEESFVDIFSGGKYGKTLGAGGTLLIFLPRNSSYYYVTDRQRLHHQLRELRNTKEGQAFPEFGLKKPATGDMWYQPTVPVSYEVWKPKAITSLVEFATAYRALETEQNRVKAAYLTPGNRTLSALSKKEKEELQDKIEADAAVRKAEVRLQLAELAAAPLLPTVQKKPAKPAKELWRTMSDQCKTAWLNQYVGADNRINSDAATSQWLQLQWDKANETVRQQRLKVYDSLQVATPSSYRIRRWLSLKGLNNVASQPVFDSGKMTDGYKRDFHDYYFEGLLSYNIVFVRPWLKQYFSGGIGLNTMRPFEKKNLQTYVTTLNPNPGFGATQVVKQADLYPTIPANRTATVVQAQYSLYLSQIHVGLDLSGKGQYAPADNRHSAALGIFVPLQTGETTLLFMPQVKWATTDQPHPFSFGFNLAASIPGFVTKDKTAKE